MAKDVTEIVSTLSSREVFLGITFEQLVVILYLVFLIPAISLWLRDLRRRRSTVREPAGCVRLGMAGPSNIVDQYDRKYDHGTNDKSKWKVKALYMYPIKSCSSVELNVADVDVEGMTWDRKFAFAEWRQALKPNADGQKPLTWVFRTLREHPYHKLALVKPEVWVPRARDGSAASNLLRVEQEGRLIVKYPNEPTGWLAPLDRLMIKLGLIPTQNAFALPLNLPKNHKYPKETFKIWSDSPAWVNMGEHLPNDFIQWLGAPNPIALFRADPEKLREVYKCAPRKEEVGFQPVLAAPDSYPLHLLNIASVHDIAHKLSDVIPNLSLRRFRPNILIEGPSAFAEDDWKRVKIGGHEVYSSCHTTRCKLPNVDPDTAERHRSQPYDMLRTYRIIDKGSPSACLGMQCVPAKNERFQLFVGDAIEVLETGEHYFLKA